MTEILCNSPCYGCKNIIIRDPVGCAECFARKKDISIWIMIENHILKKKNKTRTRTQKYTSRDYREIAQLHSYHTEREMWDDLHILKDWSMYKIANYLGIGQRTVKKRLVHLKYVIRGREYYRKVA